MALPELSNAEDLYKRASELARAGDFDQALQELHKAAEQTPNNSRVHNLLGIVLTQLGRLKEANEAYSRALSLAPDFLPARKNRAVNAFTKRDFQFAAGEFEALVRLYPRDFVPHLFLGLLAMEGSDLPMARKHLLEAHQLAPDSGQVLLALTRVHFTLGERQLALETARKMQTKSRSTDAERFELGVLLAQFEAHAEATEIFQELWRKKPGSYDVGFNLALVQYRAGQLQPALDTLEQVGARVRQRGELLNLRGWIYNKMRRLDRARESLEGAIVAEPDNPDHYLDLSTVLSSQGYTQAAIQLLAQVSSISNGARLQVQMGLVYQKDGNYQEAEKWYRKTLQADALNRNAYLALANLLWATNRQKEALELLAKAIDLLPTDALLHYLYGGQLLESEPEARPEHLEKAAAILHKSLQLNPFYANTHYILGKLYLKKGDYASAKASLEKACAFNPRHTSAYYHLSRLALQMGEKDRAQEIARIFQELEKRERWQRDEGTLADAVQDSLQKPEGGVLLTKSTE